MEQNMKPITKHLVKAALILFLVTVASLGIRRVRFSIHRARTVESPVIVEAEPDNNPAYSHTIDDKPDQQYAFVSESDKGMQSNENPEARTDLDKDDKTVSMTKPSRGSKDLEKIYMSENENLYIKEGELWYVSKQVKMQVQIDETTGQMNVIDIYDDKPEGPQPIPMGDGYNIYITDEGQTWYVGDDSKSRVEVDDTTDEITILEQYGGEDDK
jgi:hypothetical protein